jgi:hypothetical protein
MSHVNVAMYANKECEITERCTAYMKQYTFIKCNLKEKMQLLAELKAYTNNTSIAKQNIEILERFNISSKDALVQIVTALSKLGYSLGEENVIDGEDVTTEWISNN